MPDHDRRFYAILGWSIAWSAIPASVFAGGVLGLATRQLPWQGALPAMVGSVAVMAVINFVGYKQKAPQLKNPGPVMLLIAGLTWCFVGWQTWMWFHPIPPSNAQTQLDDYATKKVALATKPLKDQIEQLTKENQNLRQSGADVAKATAALRAQIVQLQSDAPVSVDKLPTSLRLSFRNGGIEELGSQNVIWDKVIGGRELPLALVNHWYVAWTIFIIFKKPITYKYMHYNDHGGNLIPAPDQTSSTQRYAIVELNQAVYNGLLDITFSNQPEK
jgi:hypothetical protein